MLVFDTTLFDTMLLLKLYKFFIFSFSDNNLHFLLIEIFIEFKIYVLNVGFILIQFCDNIKYTFINILCFKQKVK